jgi:hypothetical protein
MSGNQIKFKSFPGFGQKVEGIKEGSRRFLYESLNEALA